MSFISDLKDKLVRKLSASFLLRFADGYKTQIARVVQGINLVATGAYLLAPIIDQYAGTKLAPLTEGLNAQLALLTSWLAGQGFYELGKADAVAKVRLESK